MTWPLNIRFFFFMRERDVYDTFGASLEDELRDVVGFVNPPIHLDSRVEIVCLLQQGDFEAPCITHFVGNWAALARRLRSGSNENFKTLITQEREIVES